MPALTQLKDLLGEKPSEAVRRFMFREVGYTPSREQEEFHFAKDEDGEPLRFRLVAGGERAGKSYSSAMELFSWLPWCSLAWIVGPDFEQTRAEARYIEEALLKIGALADITKPERGPWKITTIWGTELETKSANNPETIAGKGPDAILFVEAAQAPYEAFLRVMGRVAEKRGWAVVSGTFEGPSNWYAGMYRSWSQENQDGGRSFSLPTWSNLKVFPGGREDPEILRLERLHGPDWFNERFAGVPVPPRGLVFRAVTHSSHVRMVERVKGIPLEMFPDRHRVILPIDTEDECWFDPGFVGGYSVLFVTVHNGVAVVYDEIYRTGHTGEEMVLEAMKHPRWKFVRKLVADTAAKQHQAGRSQAEIWRDATGLYPRSQKVGILDGIERTRIALRPHPETHIPQLIFGIKTKMTIWEFTEGYKYHVENDGAVSREKPVDKANHSAKAIAYGLTDVFGPVKRSLRSTGRKSSRRVAGWELLAA